MEDLNASSFNTGRLPGKPRQTVLAIPFAQRLCPVEHDIGVMDGLRVVKLAKLIAAIVKDVRGGVPASRISFKFHRTVAQIMREMCLSMSKDTGIKAVALSGGVFQNRLLARLVMESLEADGFKVLTHRDVPCNDGCISLGQVVVANFAFSR